MAKLKEMIKTKKFWIVAGAVLAAVLLFQVGYTSANTYIEEEKLNAEELAEKIEELEDNLGETEEKLKENEEILKESDSELEAALKEHDSRLSDRQDEVEEALALADEVDNLNNDIESLEGELSDKQSEIDSLSSGIGAKEDELAALEGDILQATDSPIEILSGEWIVGSDVPPGRYQASGSSNFVVYNSTGSLKVNTILRDGDYVFFAEEEDFIEASSATTLTPVE